VRRYEFQPRTDLRLARSPAACSTPERGVDDSSRVSAAHPPRPEQSTRARLEFLDACRALAVIGMLFANMMNVFLRHVPSALAHNQGDVLRGFDFPAPIFQFLIGVSLVLFLERRGGARGRAFRRFTLLVALGIVLDGVGALQSWPRWGVLQTLGLGGGIAACLADLPDAAVGAIGVAVLGIFSGGANGEVHHNVLAALAFVPLTLAGLIVGRGLAAGHARRDFVRRAVVVALASILFAAIAYEAGVPFNKVLGTSSFVALAIAVSAVFLLLLAAVEAAGAHFPRWLLAVGSNALMAWVLQYALVFYPAWLAFPSWHRLHLAAGMAATVATLVALCVLTVILGRRGFRIPI